MNIDLMTKSSDDTTKLPTHVVVQRLVDAFGPTAVAYMAKVRSRQLPPRWARPPEDADHVEPRVEARQRLLLAHSVFLALEAAEGSDQTAKQWFIAASPRLGGATPMAAVRDFESAKLHGVVRAFIGDTSGD